MVTKSEKKFPSALKNILAQFEIKNVALANAIGVTCPAANRWMRFWCI